MREEGPLVHVVDDELVLGQPGSGAAYIAVEAAGEQHGAGIDAVPAAALESDNGAQRLVDRGGETGPVQTVSSQPTDLFTEATDPDVSTAAVYGAWGDLVIPRLLGCLHGNYPGTRDRPARPALSRSPHDHYRKHTAANDATRAHAVSPETIMRIAAGFMAAKHLFAASELGLFEALGDSPATLEALAARTGLTPRSARISADAMVALGLLDRDDDRYRNSPLAAAFLARDAPGGLRPLLRFWDRISYPAWQALAQALAVGPPQEIMALGPEQQQIACAGIEAVLAEPANALTAALDFAAHRRVLDVGGGTGSWSIALTTRHRICAPPSSTFRWSPK